MRLHRLRNFAVYSAVATMFMSSCFFSGNRDRGNWNDDPWLPSHYDVTFPRIWPLVNIFNHQTSVPRSHVFEIRGIHWNLSTKIQNGFTSVSADEVALLFSLDDWSPVPMEIHLKDLLSGVVRLVPSVDLKPDSDYYLLFTCNDFMPNVLCPDVIEFTTSRAPRVLEFRHAEDTLVVVFSENMASGTLKLQSDFVDMIFNPDGEAYSAVKDLNISDFAWKTDGAMFLLAPLPDIPFKLVLGPRVRSWWGSALDVDGDSKADDGDTFVFKIYPSLLDICVSRVDFPQPCMPDPEDEEVWEMVDFTSPYNVTTGLVP